MTHQPAEPLIEIHDDAATVSRAAADGIAAALREAVAARGRADWLTTGGSTPGGIYRVLAAPPLRDEVPWAAVHVWWGDDRFVPRGHPLSNVLVFDQIFQAGGAFAGASGTGSDAATVKAGATAGVRLAPANVHAPPTGAAIEAGRGLEWAARTYEAELRRAGLEADDDAPVFDVVLLGVGPDGHVLSVFPGSALFDSRDWVSAVPAPGHVEPHVARLSLGPAVIGAARKVFVVVHGAAKAEIVAEILAGPRDPRRLPAQLARRPGARWLLDRLAASRFAG